MHEILKESQILVLMLIIALGYMIGRIRIGSFSLGIAAVLFAGLGVSALAPDLALPQLVYVFGLVLFVYTIGLSSGPSFFRALKKEGFRYIALAVAVLLVGAGATLVFASLLNINGALAVGMYSGAFTNTPALAAAMELIGSENTAPVAGYSLAYPLGIICVLAMLSLFRKVWKVDTQTDKKLRHKENTLYARTVRVTKKSTATVGDLTSFCKANIAVSRISVGGVIRLAKPNDKLRPGTLLTIVGNAKELDTATSWLGEAVTDGGLELNLSTIHTRRVFLSNNTLAGRKLGDLKLLMKYDVTVTRIRRGDVDLVAHDDVVLELGDRVKIVGAHKNLDKASAYLGDSYKHASELDILTFSLGIGLGILLGLVPIPLPGGSTFHFGAAGGALVTALILGAIGRTGKFVWQLPYGANMTLRQLGMVLFLAGIGSQGGGALRTALGDSSSIVIIVVGAVLTTLVATLTLLIGFKFMKIPFSRLSGMLAGIQTQPAVLAHANEHSADDEPNIGYASVYPVVMMGKIILVQIIVMLLA